MTKILIISFCLIYIELSSFMNFTCYALQVLGPIWMRVMQGGTTHALQHAVGQNNNKKQK